MPRTCPSVRTVRFVRFLALSTHCLLHLSRVVVALLTIPGMPPVLPQLARYLLLTLPVFPFPHPHSPVLLPCCRRLPVCFVLPPPYFSAYTRKRFDTCRLLHCIFRSALQALPSVLFVFLLVPPLLRLHRTALYNNPSALR